MMLLLVSLNLKQLVQVVLLLKESKVFKVLQVRVEVHKVSKEQQGLLEHKEQQEQLVHRVQLVPHLLKEIKVHKELKVLTAQELKEQ